MNPQEQNRGRVLPARCTRVRASAEIAEALKIFGKPVSIVSDYCQTGTDAFRFAVASVAAGMHDTVLVVGFDKPKDRGVSGPSVAFDRVRGLPATPAGWFSLCAARYFETFDAGPRGPGQASPSRTTTTARWHPSRC